MVNEISNRLRFEFLQDIRIGMNAEAKDFKEHAESLLEKEEVVRKTTKDLIREHGHKI